jgi:hypothetical protein
VYTFSNVADNHTIAATFRAISNNGSLPIDSDSFSVENNTLAASGGIDESGVILENDSLRDAVLSDSHDALANLDQPAALTGFGALENIMLWIYDNIWWLVIVIIAALCLYYFSFKHSWPHHS